MHLCFCLGAKYNLMLTCRTEQGLTFKKGRKKMCLLFYYLKNSYHQCVWRSIAYCNMPVRPSQIFCLSINQSIIRRLQWQQAKQGIPDTHLPSNTFQSLLGDTEAFPGKVRCIISSVGSGSSSGSPPQGEGILLPQITRVFFPQYQLFKNVLPELNLN